MSEKRFQVLVAFKTGRTKSFKMTEDSSNALIQALTETAPWAIIPHEEGTTVFLGGTIESADFTDITA